MIENVLFAMFDMHFEAKVYAYPLNSYCLLMVECLSIPLEPQ